jgi:hypothetical protein
MAFRRKVTSKQLIEDVASFHACTVGMGAYAGAHSMARKLATSGHEVTHVRAIKPPVLIGTLSPMFIVVQQRVL